MDCKSLSLLTLYISFTVFSKQFLCSQINVNIVSPPTVSQYSLNIDANPDDYEIIYTNCKEIEGIDEFIGSINYVNCSINIEAKSSEPKDPEDLNSQASIVSLMWHQYIVSGWLSLTVTLIGIIGNILTIIILSKSHMRNSTNTFITGLAFTDLISLLIIIFLLPLRYIFVSHNFLFYYELHTLLYPYLYPLAATFQFSSIYLMVAVCTNRVITLYLTNLSNQLNMTKNCYKVIILVFIFAVVSCLPLWFYYKVEQVQQNNQIKLFLRHNILVNNLNYRLFYHLYIIILTYVIPLLLLSIMNYSLVVFLYKSRRLKHRLGLRERNEQMITFILIMFLLLFFICQLPNFTLHVLHAFNMRIGGELSHTYFMHWANFLLLLNSSYNFMIYCALNEEFREEAKQIFTCYQLSSYLDDYNQYRNYHGGRRNLEVRYDYKRALEMVEVVKDNQNKESINSLIL